MNKIVQVAVGVIVQKEISFADQYFVTKRLATVHLANKWEFPGGKVEQGETVAEALFRELKEEIDIEILSCQPLLTIQHDYGDKCVRLEVFLVDQYLGEPSAQEGQGQGWFSLAALQQLDFPEANHAIIQKLSSSSELK